jgi:hypothetical protein
MDVAQLKAIPETQPHRVVDLDIVKADMKGATNFISKSLMLKDHQGLSKPILFFPVPFTAGRLGA